MKASCTDRFFDFSRSPLGSKCHTVGAWMTSHGGTGTGMGRGTVGGTYGGTYEDEGRGVVRGKDRGAGAGDSEDVSSITLHGFLGSVNPSSPISWRMKSLNR